MSEMSSAAASMRSARSAMFEIQSTTAPAVENPA